MTNNSLNEMEQLLLMAAAVQGLTPDSTLHFANTAKVVRQVLHWTGSFSEEVIKAWNSDEENPTIDLVYGTLIRMTQPINNPKRLPERDGEVLFEGGGNWGDPGNPDHPPAAPHFNSCRLTIHGWNLANNLLIEHPEYRKKS
jgi:hypothetical protein